MSVSALARPSLRAAAARAPASASARATYATVSEAAGGVKVAAVDAGQPTSSLTVVVKAGSRFESQPGVAHVLKNFAFKGTKAGSALKTVREAELYGGVLSAALSREHLYLTADFLRGDEDHFLSVLSSVLSSTKFTPHELNELVLPTVQAEAGAAAASPVVTAFDVAHHIAFRRGLGNSLFATPYSSVSAEDVKSYASQAFAKSNIAVLGSGISSETLSSAVSNAFGSSSAGAGSAISSPATKYYGGEQRIPLDIHAHPSAQPTLLIAYGTTASAPELTVLSHVLGGSPALKWTPGTTPLSLAADKIYGSSAKAFALPYSDATLFGVVVSAPTSEGVKALAEEVAGLLKSTGEKVSEEEVKRAVAKAKFETAAGTETREGLVALAGPQLLSGSIQPLDAAFSSYSKVSASSISKAASELFKSKPTVVAVGDLSVLPYADELL